MSRASRMSWARLRVGTIACRSSWSFSAVGFFLYEGRISHATVNCSWLLNVYRWLNRTHLCRWDNYFRRRGTSRLVWGHCFSKDALWLTERQEILLTCLGQAFHVDALRHKRDVLICNGWNKWQRTSGLKGRILIDLNKLVTYYLETKRGVRQYIGLEQTNQGWFAPSMGTILSDEKEGSWCTSGKERIFLGLTAGSFISCSSLDHNTTCPLICENQSSGSASKHSGGSFLIRH